LVLKIVVEVVSEGFEVELCLAIVLLLSFFDNFNNTHWNIVLNH
jgi:hypothetical protein